MVVRNNLVLAFCHVYPVIISGSIPRSSSAGAKAVHVIIALQMLQRDHFLTCSPVQDINSLHSSIFASLIDWKKSLFAFICILKIIGDVDEHLFTCFSLFRVVLGKRKNERSGKEQEVLRDFTVSQNAPGFWRNFPKFRKVNETDK